MCNHSTVIVPSDAASLSGRPLQKALAAFRSSSVHAAADTSGKPCRLPARVGDILT